MDNLKALEFEQKKAEFNLANKDNTESFAENLPREDASLPPFRADSLVDNEPVCLACGDSLQSDPEFCDACLEEFEA